TSESSTTESSTTEPSTTTTNSDGATLGNSHESQSTDTSAGSEATKSSSQEKVKALPQTNEQRAAWLVILGAIMVGGVFISVLKKK
ncbi:LPXTG-motif protein cell wall anchor domain protein, partial [Enterococcus casseliflavus 14-MB-W-14]